MAGAHMDRRKQMQRSFRFIPSQFRPQASFAYLANKILPIRPMVTLLLGCLLALWPALPLAAQPALAVRLEPGQDLKVELLRLAVDNQWQAACVVTCVGSLEEAHLRLADASEGTWLREKLEIVSLVGTFSQEGGHFHLSVSDGQGRTTGGHLLEGCRVYTTAEIVVMPLPHYRFPRELDPKTGYPELRPVRQN
jgi:predicted DNA-binding protein with PD1-like motif